MAIAFLIIGLLILAGAAYLVIKTLKDFVQLRRVNALTRKQFLILGSSLAAAGVSGAFLQASINVFNSWVMSPGEATLSIVGMAFFLFFFSLLWVCFVLRYWKPSMEAKQRKWVNICLFGSIPLSLIFFLMLGEGVANHLTYPLVSGFKIDGSGWHWVNYQNINNYGGLHVAWYGVIIIFGALVALWITDHRFYKKYHKHGIMDATFLVCFPAGIIGARIWYVVGNWERDGFNTNFARVFAIWEGGLTILGGAVAGIIAGALFMMIRRKYVSVRWTMDMVIPAILLSMAIGRWGNFFNHEVYGAMVNISDGWNWLPTWIANQMGYGLAEGKIYVPLFLIESMINIAGYFIIAYLVPFLWKKWRPMGALGGCYLIWYGIVRMIMEPLRDPNYNMGMNNQWSFWNAMIYIILGILLIGFCALWEYWLIYKTKRSPLRKQQAASEKEKEGEPAPIEAPKEEQEEPKDQEEK